MSRGAYLADAVRLSDLSDDSEVFAVKGGGRIIDYFSTFVDAWVTVGRVQTIVRIMGVVVHRDTVREALEKLTEMGFLEKMVSSVSPNSPAKYRRKLTDAARELAARKASMPALRSAALREKGSRRIAAR